MDLRVCGAAALGKADYSRAALVRRIGSGDITETFKAPEQLVHGLLAHASALGEGARANAIWSRELQYRDMGQAQLFKAGRIKIIDEAAMDRLRRDAQQGADQHILGVGRPIFQC